MSTPYHRMPESSFWSHQVAYASVKAMKRQLPWDPRHQTLYETESAASVRSGAPVLDLEPLAAGRQKTMKVTDARQGH